MEIKEVVKTKDVMDCDFHFVNGNRMQFTLDLEAGDSVEETDELFRVVTVAKPNLIDPEEVSPEETVTLYKRNLTVAGVRLRKQALPTEEQLFNMRKLLHNLPAEVQ
jgi:hypothetical protein